LSTPLLTIRNNHTFACGDPPIVNNSTNCYVGYFENVHGEQWVFTYDRQTKDAYLLGGDINWNSRKAVHGGAVPGLMLTGEEAAWLRACWSSAAGKQTA
jgi:hypothetical protein